VEEKLKELATIIVEHSLKVKENERVLITYKTLDVNPLVKELIKKIQEKKGIVFVNVLNDPEISSLLSMGNTKETKIRAFFLLECSLLDLLS